MKLSATLLAFFATIAVAGAHHGSADYDVGREITVEGTIAEWRWSSPHTWVVVKVARSNGPAEIWSGEGPPLNWAEARGWSKTTLHTGEPVRLVMYPSRREAHGGLVKRIERARGDLVVSRPWLDGR